MRPLLTLALVAAAGAASGQVALTDANCATNGAYSDGPAPPTEANGHIAWPADDPVWELDFYRPANRTTINGGGLEIRNVTYRGRKVFDRASVPVLNVLYEENGCGSFRDWQHEEATLEVGADAALTLPCLAESAPGDVVASCESNAVEGNPAPGGDPGAFTGVTLEDYGDELVLTGSSQAGWYRYRMKWHFYRDGRVWPEFSFAAAAAICTETGHRHHAYWRFDFDLEGTPANDVVREYPDGAPGQVFRAEASRVLRGPTDRTYWSVTDAASGAGYTIVPGEEDRRLPADAFSKTDALVLRYHADEVDDGLTYGDRRGSAFAFEPFVDGESLDGADTVFWYRSGALHTAGAPFECDIVGPMLRPFGFESPLVPGAESVEFEVTRPNPFSGSARTRFRVATTQDVTVELYDTSGRRVATLYQGTAGADAWQPVRIDGSGLPAGTYIVRLKGETASGTTRVVLVR